MVLKKLSVFPDDEYLKVTVTIFIYNKFKEHDSACKANGRYDFRKLSMNLVIFKIIKIFIKVTKIRLLVIKKPNNLQNNTTQCEFVPHLDAIIPADRIYNAGRGAEATHLSSILIAFIIPTPVSSPAQL